ncbi:hypothetical protein SAMN05216251_108253 [Actinacidiphila alni]|uniref:Uncharacterized protein n=1 Tax=Actinacidiphila alni TaxID=380248 RepID=A0A1I2G4S1_9ACTN|nr:hypothetical protein [Actinacidiphila alni]SFF12168.1 hypothetical protein SAMN05216251_108253 [Actinacidiphila alni]
MSEQPTYPGRLATIGEQRPVLLALTYLATTFPELPSAYMVGHRHLTNAISLQMDKGADVEAWRVALQVPADAVHLDRYSDYTSIQFDTIVAGVPVKVYGSTPLLPDRAALSPQEDAERRARAADMEARHQAAEAVTQVMPLAEASFAADVAAGIAETPEAWAERTGLVPGPRAAADAETGGAL